MKGSVLTTGILMFGQASGLLLCAVYNIAIHPQINSKSLFVSHPPDIRELLLRSQCRAAEELLKTSHASCWPVHAGQVCHLLRHLPFSGYLPGHQGNDEICRRYDILQQKHGLYCFTPWCDDALLSGWDLFRSKRFFSRERSANVLIPTWHWGSVTRQR